MSNNRQNTSDLLVVVPFVVPPVDTSPNGCPLKTLGKRRSSQSEKVHSDRLAGLRDWALNAARESTAEAGLRAEIARLLDRMNPDQLELARAKLNQILDTYQVSNLTEQTAE